MIYFGMYPIPLAASAQWPSDGVYASNHVRTDILGFFGFAQWPSDGVYASQRVDARLTSCVFAALPSRIESRLTSWDFFGFAQWLSDYMYASQHVNTRLTSWVFFGLAQWPSGSVDMS